MRVDSFESGMWIVGGDDVLQSWHVCRKSPVGGQCALDYVMAGDRVREFTDKVKAQTVADRLNR